MHDQRTTSRSGFLCRSALPLATWNQREYRRLAAPVLAEEYGFIEVYTQREINAIAYRLTSRTRKCLGFATPLEVHAHFRHHPPIALVT